MKLYVGFLFGWFCVAGVFRCGVGGGRECVSVCGEGILGNGWWVEKKKKKKKQVYCSSILF